MTKVSNGEALPAPWRGLIDDAAIFPPGDAALPDAVAAYTARREEWYADLVASFVVTDVRIAEVRAAAGGGAMPLSIVVTGGAGAIAGALGLAAKAGNPLAGLEVALRDPDDPAGAARRVVAACDAARSEGLLDDDTAVYVEIPEVGSPTGWLAAADVVAENEFRLKFRTGGPEPQLVPAPGTLAHWIDAALDRETPFKCTAGLHRAVRHSSTEGPGQPVDQPIDQHGFLNLLLATRQAFDGATTAEVVATLERRDGGGLAADAGNADLAGARRWFTSFGSCSVREPLDDLIALGLVTPPSVEREPDASTTGQTAPTREIDGTELL
jgi:hypothetical protein